jgi:Protein of unknown function (DUF732)
MTEHQDDTMAADVQNSENSEKNDHTTASALGADADTTWVPADPATVDQYAWSEGDEIEVDLSHPWFRAVAIAVGLLALGTVAAVVVAANGRHGNDLHGSALPVTVHSSAAAPVLSAPVTTVTVTATPPAPPSKTVDVAPTTTTAAAAPTPLIVLTQPPVPKVPESQRDRYIGALRQHGLFEVNPSLTDRNVQEMCRLMASGHSIPDIAAAFRTGNPTLSVEQSEFVVRTALSIYCPSYGDGNANY